MSSNKLLISYIEECQTINASFIRLLKCSIPILETKRIYCCMFKWSSSHPYESLKDIYEACIPFFKIELDYFHELFGEFNWIGLVDDKPRLYCLTFILEHCIKSVKNKEDYNCMLQIILLVCKKIGFFVNLLRNQDNPVNKLLNNCGKKCLEELHYNLSISTIAAFINHFNCFFKTEPFPFPYTFGLKFDCIYTYYEAIYKIQQKNYFSKIEPILSSIFYSDIGKIISPYIQLEFKE
jgi:hypothetical protein